MLPLKLQLTIQGFMMEKATSPILTIDIEELGFDRGGYLLVKRALNDIAVGERLGVRGRAAELPIHLRGWCRAQGHDIIWPDESQKQCASGEASPLVAWLVRGSALIGRWRNAGQAGHADASIKGAVVDRPS